MTEDEVVGAVRKALKEDREKFWVPGEQHFLDHDMLRGCREAKEEWMANHQFITNVRRGISVGEKAGIVVIVGSAISFIAGAIWLAVKESLR